MLAELKAAFYAQWLQNLTVTNNYTKYGEDWVIPETMTQDGETSQEGIDAVKSELMAGRGVSISFYADTSMPGEEVTEGCMNLATRAQVAVMLARYAGRL